MPPREQGLGRGCGACEAGGTLVALTSPASGPGTKAAWLSSDSSSSAPQPHQCCRGWFWPRLRPGHGGRRGSGTRVPEDPEGTRPVGNPAAAELKGGHRRFSTPVKTLTTAGPVLMRQLPATGSHHQVPIPWARG